MKICVDGAVYVVLSLEAPLARAMAGLEAGDEVIWREQDLEIVDIG